MARITSEFQPNFSLFPVNNNRTGYQPVNIPLVLVVPYTRTTGGIPINNSNVCEVSFLVEDAPGRTPVAAPANIGLFVPNFDRFRLNISSAQLAEVRIDTSGRRYFDSNGNEKTFEEAVDGDFMEYGMLRGPIGAFNRTQSGPVDRIPFLTHAEYYDMSPFIIETVDLPVGKYNFVWQASYFPRIISPDNEFVCIDGSKKVQTRYSYFINHPGDIHQAMIKNTPDFYFEGTQKDNDPTIAFYRPFADALQDIFDEQELIKGINYVDQIPVQYIPYLAYLLGLDLPYFTQTTDNTRRALLRNGRKLQQLKGSARAIKELFEIFGFVIDVSNLWYSKDGTRFIAPNEPLPDEIDDQEIITQNVCHAEPLLSAYNTPGFGQLEVPLLFRALGNITVDGWLVEDGSEADLALQAAVNATAIDLEAFNTDRCALTLQGFQSSTTLQNSIPSAGVLGHSTVLVNQERNGINEAQMGSGMPLSAEGIVFDVKRNSLTITFDHFLSFNRGQKLYVFATYERTKIILPPDLNNLRSNRFDINILLFKDGEQPTSDVLQFVLDFLFKFKAFHSLLRKIAFAAVVDDIYNVTDFCAGGTQAQCPYLDAGALQIPPPIIPDLSNPEGSIGDRCPPASSICNNDGLRAGSKTEDIAFRSKILNSLEQEHTAWKELDGKYDVPESVLPIYQSLSRIKIRPSTQSQCEYTQYGQDRVFDNGLKDFDHAADNREGLCDRTSNTNDYCYKGRVQQDITTDRTLLFEEIFRCKPCGLSAGKGSYFTTPLIPDNEFSGGDSGTNAADLRNIETLRIQLDAGSAGRSRHDGAYTRIMAFENPIIHYSDRVFLDNLDDTVNNRFFATQKPSLDIVKDNMGIPGHRFISMSNLADNFFHPNYMFRPWDYLFDILCPEDMPVEIDLNANIIIGSDGDEYLSWDSFQLVYYGNGLPADIPVMNDHTVSPINQNDVTHSIWSSASPGPSFMNQSGTITTYVIDQSDHGLRYPTEALAIDAQIMCFTDILGPIFDSANRNCDYDDLTSTVPGQSLEDILPEETGIIGGTGTSVTLQGGADYIDGYPSEFGLYSVNLDLYDFPRERLQGYGFSIYSIDSYGADSSMAAMGPALALMLPTNEKNPVELQFKIGSAIRVPRSSVEYSYYKPYRMDCGASLLECPVVSNVNVTEVTAATDITGGSIEIPMNNQNHGVLNFGIGNFGGNPPAITPEELIIDRCHEKLFQLDNGSYDWNCDRVIVVPKMILNEKYGAISCLMDGSIPNMISFDDEKIIYNTLVTAFDEIPQEGNYQFIDAYGIIHIGVFETFEDRLDITTQCRDPRVWGKDPSGEVLNFRLFRDGVVTTERQIIQVADFGFIIVAEGVEQSIERFQTTFGCGDEEYIDPFAFHLCANIVDEVDIEMIPANVTTGTDITGTG